jgi:hypothetical protein
MRDRPVFLRYPRSKYEEIGHCAGHVAADASVTAVRVAVVGLSLICRACFLLLLAEPAAQREVI